MAYHSSLAAGRWSTLSFFEQMANIGSEVERTVNWQKKDARASTLAFERGLELIDLTIADIRNRARLKELCRMREVFVDYVLDNQYQSTPALWQSYFYPFIIAARKKPS